MLPTPFLSEVPGAAVSLPPHRDRLCVELPSQLVPLRRYARARVSVEAHCDSFLIELLHEEPFVKATPGRNAWQSEAVLHSTATGHVPQSVRRYECRWGRLIGSAAAALDALERYLRHLALRGKEAVPLVRVTPEGFQLRLPGHRHPGAFERFRDHEAQVVREVARRMGHGAGTGRWSGKGLQPHNFPLANTTTKETEDMSKVDTTTADTLPAALVAGQSVVRCTFDDGGKTYGYYAGGLALAEGDAVVVASPYGDGPGNRGTFDEGCGGYLKVVRVVSVEPDVEAIERAAKWIIGKVDTAEYVARRERIEELRVLDAQIKRAAAEARRRIELQALVDASPELAGLLAKRDAIARQGELPLG